MALTMTLEQAQLKREQLIKAKSQIDAELATINRIIKEHNKIKQAKISEEAHQRKLRELAMRERPTRAVDELHREKQSFERMMRSNSNRYGGENI